MARRENPCTKEEFDNPNLISDSYEHVVIDGMEVTAENVWNWDGDRNELVEKLVDYFYETGFVPYIDMTDGEIEAELIRLRREDSSKVVDGDGYVKNSSRLCLDVCRTFCMKEFYSTRVNGTPSVFDVYADKDLLRKVLKNRMGWYTSTEEIRTKGKNITGEHPYLFDISHKMVVQGCHSSMVSANVSNFRPLVAKLLMERHCRGSRVLDLSAVWCARFLAAWSLGLEYFGIDPMTAGDVRRLSDFISRRPALANRSSASSVFVGGVSEDSASYASVPDVDYVIACPPYFKLEEYKCDGNSTDAYPEYADWLSKYWGRTVANAASRLRKGGRFTLIMVERWGKFELLRDMSGTIESAGMTKVEELSYRTTRSHLTDKRRSGNVSKATEKIVTFEKR